MNPRARETKAFVCAHLLILGVVLLGFARTFYLHGLFFSKPLPWRLIVHGTVLTLWVILVVLQGLLALAGQRAWHARLAWLAGALVVGVVATGAWVTVVLDMGLVSAAEPENIFIWIDYFTLLSFPLLVAMAVRHRRNRAVHLRLILFASILLSVPALGRLALWPIFHAGLAGAPVFALTGLVLLVLMVVGWDLATARRVHGASLAGIAGVALPWMLGVAMGASGLGFALLHRA